VQKRKAISSMPVKALHRLGDIGLASFGGDRQRPQDFKLCICRETFELLTRRLDPRNSSCVPAHPWMVTNMSPPAKNKVLQGIAS
jgi:hypothetical protein